MQPHFQIALMNIQKEILYEGLYDRVLEDMEDSEMFQECCFSFVIRTCNSASHILAKIARTLCDG